jgi:predicted DNA-binding protein YlxM (UPF0122 family)
MKSKAKTTGSRGTGVLQLDRTESERLEAALATMSRMTKEAKDRMRAHFLHGHTAAEIAQRSNMTAATISNAIRRVRDQLLALDSPSLPKQRGRRVAVIVRARAEDLEPVLASFPRMEEQTKERMRAYFVNGLSLPQIAARDGIRVEGVANSARRVRAALEEQCSPWQFLDVELTLPIGLAQELQGLSDGLATMRRRREADATLEAVLDAVRKARKQLSFSR